MKKLLSLAAVALFTLTATAQNEQIEASGKTITDKREVANFEKLSVSGPFDIILTNATPGTIQVEGSDNITGLITTEVVDGTLEIAVKKGNRFKASRYNKITIRVPFTLLNEINFNGSGSIKSEKKITTAIKVKLNGTGSILLDISAPKTEAELIGSGNITLKGISETFICVVTGSGSLKATELQSDTVNASITGSGSIKLTSKKTVVGRIHGSGSIAYAGSPKETDLDKTGSGKFITL